MFFKKRLFAIFLSLFGFVLIGNNAEAGVYFAKVVVLGTYGAGKTTLLRLLSEDNISGSQVLDNTHTKQISDKSLVGKFFENEANQVVAYYYDTSGERRHQELMKEFSGNAHVVLVVADAKKMVDNDGFFKKSIEVESVFNDLHKNYNPRCKVIIILTQSDNIKSSRKDTTLWEMEKYMDELVEKNPFTSAYVDGLYQLMINDSDSAFVISNHKKNILGLIGQSLKNYGVTNLSSDLSGFRGEVITDYKEYEVIDRGTCYNSTRKVRDQSYRLNTK